MKTELKYGGRANDVLFLLLRLVCSLSSMLFLAVISFLVVLMICARYFLITAVIISQSMSPAFEIGDRVLALRYWPKKWLRKGQVVLIIHPTQSYNQNYEGFQEVPLIKRIVGLAGDNIATFHIDKSKRGESNLSSNDFIPENFFYVMGDLPIEENNSLSLGAISYEQFYALVLFKLPRREKRNC